MSDKKEASQLFNEQFQDMLAVPANQLSLSIMFFETALKAMKQQQNDELRRSNLPVITRAFYPGSIKAVVRVVDYDAPQVELTADLYEEDPENAGEWISLTVNDEFQQPLKKLVLSQATHDGDVWYMATSAQVNEVAAAVADQYAKYQSVN